VPLTCSRPNRGDGTTVSGHSCVDTGRKAGSAILCVPKLALLCLASIEFCPSILTFSSPFNGLSSVSMNPSNLLHPLAS